MFIFKLNYGRQIQILVDFSQFVMRQSRLMALKCRKAAPSAVAYNDLCQYDMLLLIRLQTMEN